MKRFLIPAIALILALSSAVLVFAAPSAEQIRDCQARAMPMANQMAANIVKLDQIAHDLAPGQQPYSRALAYEYSTNAMFTANIMNEAAPWLEARLNAVINDPSCAAVFTSEERSTPPAYIARVSTAARELHARQAADFELVRQEQGGQDAQAEYRRRTAETAADLQRAMTVQRP